MIGIIGAMPVEVDGLTAILNEKQGEAVSGIVFYQGKISGVSCVVACCGPGKVNAAVCTQAMLMRYPVSLVINTGVAGGIGPASASATWSWPRAWSSMTSTPPRSTASRGFCRC